MIINISRVKTFQTCRRKAYNSDILGLQEHGLAEPLVFGGALHKGFANFYSTRSIADALVAGEAELRERWPEEGMLPEEHAVREKVLRQTQSALRTYCDNYRDSDFTVLQPEVQFLVPLPFTIHHCYFFHKILHPGEPEEACVDPRCSQPHRLGGRTDAIIQMNKLVWLLEHKTTSITGSIFFKHWLLNWQPTGYIYGIWKSIGLRPHGFVLNIIKKPNKRAADQFAFGFEREGILKSDDDLKQFEYNVIQIANDYENAVRQEEMDTFPISGMYMNPEACTNYNRVCQFFDHCKRGHVALPGEFATREPDYIDEFYKKIIEEETAA